MTLYDFGNERATDYEMNNILGEALNLSAKNMIRRNISAAQKLSADGEDWHTEAYTDSTGRNNYVNTNKTSAAFSTNKYIAITSTTEPFVIIVASDLTESDFAINNCRCVKVEAGKYQLTCTTGTDEVKRAQIYKTLFYGSNGTDPRVSTVYIDGLTELKTSVARDVGKRAYFFGATATSPAVDGTQAVASWALTFSDTTNNTDCSSWSYVSNYRNDNTTANYTKWEIPTGTVRNTASGNVSTVTVDETGTNLSADENDNPANGLLAMDTGTTNHNYDASGDGRVIILCAGEITSVFTETVTGSGSTTNSSIDFFTLYEVPLLTATTESVVSIITHTITSGSMGDALKSVVGIPLFSNWETGADLQYKLVNAGIDETEWLNLGNTLKPSKVYPFRSGEPTELIIKLIPKSSSPTTGTPGLYGFALRAN